MMGKLKEGGMPNGLTVARIQTIFAADNTNVNRSSKSAAIYKVDRNDESFYSLKKSSNTQLYRVPSYLMKNLPNGAKTKAVNLIANKTGATNIQELKLQMKVQLA